MSKYEIDIDEVLKGKPIIVKILCKVLFRVLVKVDLSRLDIRILSCMQLLTLGIFIYGFSVANIYFVYRSDFWQFIGKAVLWGYFGIGVMIVLVTYHFYNRKILFLSVLWFVILWTILTASLCALQVAADYPWLQVRYIVFVMIQLVFLMVFAMKRNFIPTMKKVFTWYCVVMALIFAYLLVPPLLNGDGRWSGPDHIGWYEKKYGAEVADVMIGPFIGAETLALVVGIFIWGLRKFYVKCSFVNYEAPVCSYLVFYPAEFKINGIKGGFGYALKGSEDMASSIMFIREERGRYYFNRILFSGSEEELIFFKEEGMKEGFFLCEVVGSDKKSEKVIALYQEKKGNWRPFEIEEVIETKTRSD